MPKPKAMWLPSARMGEWRLHKATLHKPCISATVMGNRPADPWRVLAGGIGGPADREQGAKGGRGCLSAGIRRGGQ